MESQETKAQGNRKRGVCGDKEASESQARGVTGLDAWIHSPRVYGTPFL